MLPNLIQKLTAILALSLVGLVGGLGTGLHWVFDCCHHCHHACESGVCCSHSCSHVTVEQHSCSSCRSCVCESRQDQRLTSSKQSDKNGKHLVEPEHDCAICRLLSQYHSPITIAPTQQFVWASQGSVALAQSQIFEDFSRRLEHPRGPPA